MANIGLFMVGEDVEFHVTTNFTFLEGASHPEELIVQASKLGYKALGITDKMSLAGVVRAYRESQRKDCHTRILVGCELVTQDDVHMLAYPKNLQGYGQISTIITRARRHAAKGSYHLEASVMETMLRDVILILPGYAHDTTQMPSLIDWGVKHWGSHFYVGIGTCGHGNDQQRMATEAYMARTRAVGLIACNHTIMHTKERQPIADFLQAIQKGCCLHELGQNRQRLGQKRLLAGYERARLFASYPDALAQGRQLANKLQFDLSELEYHYPNPVGSLKHGTQEELVRRVENALGRSEANRTRLAKLVQHELGIVEQLGFAPYFLTVHDIVQFARDKGILCQGRGSAANSVICFLLGITAVDPEKIDVLFERFVSPERKEPPDIDVDFEHERREEVIQHIYNHYGRDHAALAATVVHYRARRAIREVGRVMGFSEDMVAKLASQSWGWRAEWDARDALKDIGFDIEDPQMKKFVALVNSLIGFPRHLSQHVGGFVITHNPISEMVPVENAAMENRTVIQWDKDDLDYLGILKIDILSLGMLSCIRRGFTLLQHYYGLQYDLASIPREDPKVYDMLGEGDSLGVFQVESRAQMAFLPRMKPKCFYDLVIEVAIVRPGPIQGDMVHPYLRRRNGEEPIVYASRELQDILGKTLGVPLFQEQAMRIAVVAAGFTPGEADQLRRAMATFRKVGTISYFQERMVKGMVARGYDADFAWRCFRQIEGFGEYGFPESHAASFALLVYASAWLKARYPDVFCASLLNAQPLGFYAPAQIVADAKRHGVEVRPVCVNASHWDCTLEPDPQNSYHAVRLGLRHVRGLAMEDAMRLVQARGNGYQSLHDVWQRANLSQSVMTQLSAADCFHSFGLERRDAQWGVLALPTKRLPLLDHIQDDETSAVAFLPPEREGEKVMSDYRHNGLSLRAHPLELLRPQLKGYEHSKSLSHINKNSQVWLAGLALIRQRPGTAKGVTFITLEDEYGIVNIVVKPSIYARYRQVVVHARLMIIHGLLERRDGVIHVVAHRLQDRSSWLDSLDRPDLIGLSHSPRTQSLHPRDQWKTIFPSRDFH